MKKELIKNGVKVEINQKDIIEALVDESIKNFEQLMKETQEKYENNFKKWMNDFEALGRKIGKIPKNAKFIDGYSLAKAFFQIIEKKENVEIIKRFEVFLKGDKTFKELQQVFEKRNDCFIPIKEHSEYGIYVLVNHYNNNGIDIEQTMRNIEGNRLKIERALKTKFTKAYVKQMTPALQNELRKMLN